MVSELQRRCIDITYKHHLTHLNGVLGAVDIIDHIYSVKKEEEPFILSNGHVGLALYVVLEKYYGFDAETLTIKHGTHPNRDEKDKIWCSTGSLGMGLTVAVGMAMADRKRDVYVMTSDGEMAEGSCWEALRIASDYRLENLRITCLANGSSGYQKVDSEILDIRMQYFYPSLVQRVHLYELPDWIQSFPGHYVKLDDKKYREITL